MAQNTNITFIGGGHLTTFMLQGLIQYGYDPKQITVCDHHIEKRTALSKNFNVTCVASITEAIATANIILLSVKPNAIAAVCETLSPIDCDQLIISLAAGISIDEIQQKIKKPGAGIIRTMTNLATQVGQATTILVGSENLSNEHKYMATNLFNLIGTTTWLNKEEEINTYSPLVGSGPGFIFYFLEALQDAAIDSGVCKQHAKEITVQIAKGAIELLNTTQEPAAALRKKVTTEKGITAAGLSSLEASDYRSIITNAYQASKKRCLDLESEKIK